MRNFQKGIRRRVKRETSAERLLERKLKGVLGEGEVIKQFPIGPYIADFYLPSFRIVVEADGRQHYTEKGLNHDRERGEYLEEMGIRTIRFSNREIIESTKEVILKIVKAVESYKKNKLSG